MKGFLNRTIKLKRVTTMKSEIRNQKPEIRNQKNIYFVQKEKIQVKEKCKFTHDLINSRKTD